MNERLGLSGKDRDAGKREKPFVKCFEDALTCFIEHQLTCEQTLCLVTNGLFLGFPIE